MVRASLMGVRLPDDNFASVDILRELEKSRVLLNEKQVDDTLDQVVVRDNLGQTTPLFLTWGNSESVLDEPFVLVQPRKKKKKSPRKKNVTILRLLVLLKL